MLTPFGEWVRAFRERRQITLREMARTLGRSPSFLSAIELGRKSVPETIVREITAKFGVQGEDKLELERRVSASRTEAKVRFEDKAGQKEKEVAMLFARNFDGLTDEQTERIRKILEERDDKSRL